MVKIRLKRLGYKRNPIYRIIVINNREKREGKPVAELGIYNPKRKELRLDKTSALDWVKKGAKPTETVQYLIDNSDDNGNLVRKEAEEKKLSKKAQSKIEAEEKAKKEAEAKAAEEAAKKAEEEAKAKAEAEAKAAEEKAASEAETESVEAAESTQEEEAQTEA